METVSVKELIDAGIHFGCKTSQWNPKMKPYIKGKRNLIHIIDVEQTLRGLIRAQNYLQKLTATGAQVLFVGTKKQIRPVIEAEAKRCGMPFVVERWIGGSLTNYAVIRKRLQRLEELENLEATGEIEERYSKKIVSSMRRERKKISRNLEGIRAMNGLPGAIFVVDPKREEIAVKEARRMGVPTVCLLDTDCNPDYADIAIPGNDDAMKSVLVIMAKLADAVIAGREIWRETQASSAAEDQAADAAGEGGAARAAHRGGARRGGSKPGAKAPEVAAAAAEGTKDAQV